MNDRYGRKGLLELDERATMSVIEKGALNQAYLTIGGPLLRSAHTFASLA